MSLPEKLLPIAIEQLPGIVTACAKLINSIASAGREPEPVILQMAEHWQDHERELEELRSRWKQHLDALRTSREDEDKQ